MCVNTFESVAHSLIGQGCGSTINSRFMPAVETVSVWVEGFMLRGKHACFHVWDWPVCRLCEAVKRRSKMRARQFEVENERCPFSFEHHRGLSCSHATSAYMSTCQLRLSFSLRCLSQSTTARQRKSRGVKQCESQRFEMKYQLRPVRRWRRETLPQEEKMVHETTTRQGDERMERNKRGEGRKVGFCSRRKLVHTVKNWNWSDLKTAQRAQH